MKKIATIFISICLCMQMFASAQNPEILLKGKIATPKILFKEITNICKKIGNPEKEFNFIFFASMIGYPDFAGVSEVPAQFALVKAGEKPQFIFAISAEKKSFLARQLLNLTVSKYENPQVISAFYGAKNAGEIIPIKFENNQINGLFELEGAPEEVLKFLKVSPPQGTDNILKNTKKIKVSCNTNDDFATIQTRIFPKDVALLNDFASSVKEALKTAKILSEISISKNECVVITTKIKFAELEKIAMSIIENALTKNTEK